jgi:hypothetical protein
MAVLVAVHNTPFGDIVDTEDDLLRGAEIALTLARRGPAGTVGRVDRAALIRARQGRKRRRGRSCFRRSSAPR